MIDFQRKIMLRYGRGVIALFRVYSLFFCAVAITMSQCQKKHNLPNCFGTSGASGARTVIQLVSLDALTSLDQPTG